MCICMMRISVSKAKLENVTDKKWQIRTEQNKQSNWYERPKRE